MDNLIKTLHDTSMLAYVNVRIWSARKLDRKATKRLTDEAGASAEAARVNKYLLANADVQLKKLQRLARQAREALINRSLPWDEAGNRLVSNYDTFGLLGELYAIEQEFAAAVDEFCQEYPRLRSLAIQSLGDMAAEEDYPPVEVVREKFSIRSSLTPLPAGFSDVRVGLSPEQQEALRHHYEAQSAERYQTALTAAWERLRDNVERFADRLTLDDEGNPKVFQASLVTNIRETMELLKNLNVFDSPELERMRYQIEDTLCQHEAPVLRANYSVAEAARTSAADLVKRLNDLLGQ
jgi:hypothetical protein